MINIKYEVITVISKIQQVYFLKLIKIYLMMHDKNKKKYIYLLKGKHKKKKMQISIIIYNAISLKHFKTETRFFNFLILI